MKITKSTLVEAMIIVVFATILGMIANFVHPKGVRIALKKPDGPGVSNRAAIAFRQPP